MVGVAQRQRRGHWDTTPANAWGAVTVRRFAELYPASAITGVTNIGLAGATASQSCPLPAEPLSPLLVALAAPTMSPTPQRPATPSAPVPAQPPVPSPAPPNPHHRPPTPAPPVPQPPQPRPPRPTPHHPTPH